jgi:hypothetical protein
VLLASTGIGCGNGAKQQPPTETAAAPDFSTPPVQTTVTPIAVRQMDLPVKEGTMPLFYLVETTGGVRVVDMATHQALAQTMARSHSIVAVDENRGVSIGDTIFTPGPLPADHRYGVYFDPGGFNPEEDIRTSTERGDPSILHKQNSDGGNSRGVSTTGPSPHQ